MYITENDAELIGTNVDRTDGKDRLRPSGGSLVKLVQTAAGNVPVTVMGKPDTFGFDLLRKQHSLEEKPLDKFLMVGDNLETDILMGNNCGIDSLLVLSGVTNVARTQTILQKAKKGETLETEGVPTYV
jgi:ribonucleotide monophosphatase NagD (HAD superfamily)